MTNQTPAEALRQQLEVMLRTIIVDAYTRGHRDGVNNKLRKHKASIYARKPIKALAAYAATVEREAASRELKQLAADTLTPENVGGHFIHDEVKEFAKQQREFIDARLAALQGTEE